MAYAAISKPSLHMNTVLYEGDGSGATVSGVGFQPDLNWTKQRTGTEANFLVDSLRGVTKTMYSNDTSSEDTYANGLTAFNADGYVHGDLNGYAQSSIDFVSWNWKAGTTSGITGGTITPTSYSINTVSGFGMYKYTGTGSAGTIAHGLGTAPKVVITKGFDAASKSWCWGQDEIAWTNEMFLNTTAAKSASTGAWNDTDPTDTLISLGTGGNGNDTGVNYIMYAWTPIKGYSHIGGYDGNNDDDGNFIYTGMKPGCIIIKRHSSIDNWVIFDNKRLGYNSQSERLYPNLVSAEEGGSGYIDFLSNGFKLRSNWSTINGNSGYVYMAFAGEPLVANIGSGIPATARG